MKKYYIIPHSMVPVFEVEANSPEEAMSEFALQMDLDMNAYFKAVDDIGRSEAELDESRRKYVEWAKDEIETEWECDDSDLAEEIADRAFDIYTEGDGYTEYECIELAVNEYHLRYREE